MQVTFNAKERTLREIVVLAISAGWKVTKVTRAQRSLFGHILAVPVAIPPQPEENEPVIVVKAEKAGRDVGAGKEAVDVSQESRCQLSHLGRVSICLVPRWLYQEQTRARL
jgi:hypothetical protein